jgi:hypothetical protein
MSEYSQCQNGHYFKKELSACPYCPASQQASGGGQFDRTLHNSPSGPDNNLGKTQILGGNDSGSNDNTWISGSNNSSAPKRDLSRTFIAEVGNEAEGESPVIRSARKLTGWLVSYTIDQMGVDFKIFEGNNTIGRDKTNSICVTTDNTISGHHATILNKKSKFYIKDELAANGTFINGMELEIGKPYELNDKDILKVGATIFKFHTAE